MYKDLVNLRVDFAFKRLFGVKGNEEILIGFLNAVLKNSLEEPITSLHVEDPHLPKNHKKDKLSILDLRATLNNGIKVNIEIQIKNKKDMVERSLYYWARMYSSQLEKGDDYKYLRKTITINLIDFILFTNKEGFHTKGRFTDEDTNHILSEHMELHFIEIPKIIQQWQDELINPWKDTFVRWMLLFPAHENEHLTKVLEEIAMEKDPILKKAIQDWEYMSSDVSFRRIYEAREKHLRDRNAELEYAKEEERIQIILNLYKTGVPIETIATATQLSINEIQTILDKKQEE